MLRIVVPILLILVGLGLGGGLGLALRPEPQPPTEAELEAAAEAAAEAAEASVDYVKLNNQFVVPVLRRGRVAALVVLSLSLEVKTGAREMAFSMEPKLRDVLLTVLFEHANAGGFDGAFTESRTMKILRQALVEAGRGVMGDALTGVLVIDIVRQDIS